MGFETRGIFSRMDGLLFAIVDEAPASWLLPIPGDVNDQEAKAALATRGSWTIDDGTTTQEGHRISLAGVLGDQGLVEADRLLAKPGVCAQVQRFRFDDHGHLLAWSRWIAKD